MVLGRWLLPKGKLTRDQFSQLMLVYLGMAADIAEIPESFREFKVNVFITCMTTFQKNKCKFDANPIQQSIFLFSLKSYKVILEPNLTIAILFVWSWSLLQFCLVLGGSHRGRKSRY